MKFEHVYFIYNTSSPCLQKFIAYRRRTNLEGIIYRPFSEQTVRNYRIIIFPHDRKRIDYSTKAGKFKVQKWVSREFGSCRTRSQTELFCGLFSPSLSRLCIFLVKSGSHSLRTCRFGKYFTSESREAHIALATLSYQNFYWRTK